MRLFVEAVVDREALDSAWAAGQSLREESTMPSASVRWVRRDAFHLTLRFLGEVEEERTADLAGALATLSGSGSIPLQIDRWGVFGGRHPRVIWLGSEPSRALERLIELRSSLDRALQAIGWEPESAPYRPHLTFGRVRRQASRDDQQAIRDAVAARPPPRIAARIGAVALVESTLTSEGPHYRRVARSEL